MSKKLVLADSAASNVYPNLASPQVSLDFEPCEFMLRADAGNAAEVAVSFDGTNDHIILGLPTAAGCGQAWVYFRTKVKKVWVRSMTNMSAAKVWVAGKTDV